MKILSYGIVLLSFSNSYSFIIRNFINKYPFQLKYNRFSQVKNCFDFDHQKLYSKHSSSSEEADYTNYHKELELKSLRQRVAELSGPNFTLEENFIKASGPGGQKINKSAICDQLIYFNPSSNERIIIKSKKHRTLLLNRIEATKLLIARLEEIREKEQMEADREEYIEYIHLRPLSEKVKNRRMKDKKHRSLKKQLRSKSIHESEY